MDNEQFEQTTTENDYNLDDFEHYCEQNFGSIDYLVGENTYIYDESPN